MCRRLYRGELIKNTNASSRNVLFIIQKTRFFQSFFVDWYAGVLEAVSLQPCSVDHSASRGEKRRAQQVVMELEALMHAPQLLLWREPG
jgi:hypothetical protein